MDKERRRSVRTKKSLICEYSENPETLKWTTTFISDIGQGGLCILTYKNFKVYDILTLRINIPSGSSSNRVEAKAQVISESRPETFYKHKTRLRFLDLKPEQETLIREYINWAIKQTSR